MSAVFDTPGVVDDDRYHESITARSVGPVATMFGITLIVFTTRIYARYHTYKSLWWDDFIMAIAMVSRISRVP